MTKCESKCLVYLAFCACASLLVSCATTEPKPLTAPNPLEVTVPKPLEDDTSLAERANWMLWGAKQGHRGGQVQMGFMYERGMGVPQDYAEAAKWYRKAAERGERLAQYNLGIMYKEGKGVPRDIIQAYVWLSLSMLKGYPYAQKDYDLVAGQMTAAQKMRARKYIRDWQPKEDLTP